MSAATASTPQRRRPKRVLKAWLISMRSFDVGLLSLADCGFSRGLTYRRFGSGPFKLYPRAPRSSLTP